MERFEGRSLGLCVMNDFVVEELPAGDGWIQLVQLFREPNGDVFEVVRTAMPRSLYERLRCLDADLERDRRTRGHHLN